ncbi:MAG: hypothetical protein WCB04_15685 [Mycobacteriales bacterium]
MKMTMTPARALTRAAADLGASTAHPYPMTITVGAGVQGTAVSSARLRTVDVPATAFDQAPTAKTLGPAARGTPL